MKIEFKLHSVPEKVFTFEDIIRVTQVLGLSIWIKKDKTRKLPVELRPFWDDECVAIRLELEDVKRFSITS